VNLPKIRCLVIVRLSFSCFVLSAEVVDVEFFMWCSCVYLCR